MRTHVLGWGFLAAMVATPAFGQREWYLWPDRFDGNWNTETSGGYSNGAPAGQPFDGRYFWGQGFDGVRRAYWKFENGVNCIGPEVPSEPRMYVVETWVPAAHSPGSSYSPLEVIMDGYDQWKFWDPNVPWGGQFGTNRQWIQRNLGNQGDWVECGLGPQAPELIPGDPYSRCFAGGNGQIMWLKRGSVMYVMFNFAFYNANTEVGVSAVRLTEVYEPTSVCGAPIAGGGVDLRCVGNANPLLGVGTDLSDSEDNAKFANSHDKMMAQGDTTLAAQGWVRPCSDYLPTITVTPITRGLPADGNYTVHLPAEDVGFKLGYEGLPVVKWRPGDISGGPFDQENIFILNPSGPREFVEKKYQHLYLLSCKTGGSNGQLVAEAVYTDNSVDTFAFNLNDWQGTDGDASSQAVGLGGALRSSGPEVDGFRRVNNSGQPANTDLHDHNATFLMYHAAQLSTGKTLKQIRLRVQPDGRGTFNGNAAVVALSLDSSLCKNPVFDVVGGGIDGSDPDGAVDVRDFGVFQQCMFATTTPGQNFDPIICGCFDLVADYVIDSSDFLRFQNCWTGPAPATPVNPDCDD